MNAENALQIFQDPRFGEIRIIREGDKVLFCGVDVARALGYAKPQNAIATHCKGALKRGILTNGGEQVLNFIPVGDLYRLAAKSHLDGADTFESWIFDEVIPSVMQTGSYSVNQNAPASTEHMFMLQARINIEHKERMEALEREQSEQREQLEATNRKISDAVNVFAAPSFSPDTWQAETKKRVTEIAESKGIGYQAFWNLLYDRLELIAGVNLGTRQKNRRARKKAEGATRRELDAITKLSVIASEKELRAIFDGILREEQAKMICA